MIWRKGQSWYDNLSYPELEIHSMTRLMYLIAPRDDHLRFVRVISPHIPAMMEDIHSYISTYSKWEGGKQRTYRVPNTTYMIFLRYLAKHFFHETDFQWSPYLHGVRRGTSTLTCFDPHRNNKYFLFLDLESAYETTGKVQKVLTQLVRLYTKSNRLVDNGKELIGDSIGYTVKRLFSPFDVFPRGFPTSPYLFHLAIKMDSIIPSINRLKDSYPKDISERFQVSMYADNIAISSSLPFLDIGRTVRIASDMIEAKGWKVNTQKTRYRVLGPNNGVDFLGLVLKNTGEICLSQSSLRACRRRLWQCSRELVTEDGNKYKSKTWYTINGILSYLHMVYGNSLPKEIIAPHDEIMKVMS